MAHFWGECAGIRQKRGLFFGARVSLVVGGFELLEGGVGIDLRSGEAAVSEEGLDGVDIGSVVEHLGCERMAEDVWRVFLERRHLPHARTNNSVDIADRGFTASVVDKERLVGSRR